MNKLILLLIKTVNDNYTHIQELETLYNVLSSNPDYYREALVCRTTHNAQLMLVQDKTILEDN